MAADTFSIGGRAVSSDRCLIVGEVAQSHDGSLGMAHAFVDAIARGGADAVKFQTHIAAAESTPGEPWRVRFSTQDATRYDYWRRMEFSEAQWRELRVHCDERGVLFLSSPFSVEAVQLLSRVGVPAWKVASGEASDVPLIDAILETALPVLLSTGMSPLREIDVIVEQVRSRSVPFAVLQCSSSYPCPPERVGLNLLQHFQERYKAPVGLSDHSGTIYPSLAAAVLGASVLEVHVTLSREMFGPDVAASVTTEDLRRLVEGVRFIEAMRRHPVDKDAVAEAMRPMRDVFTKSIVARRDLDAGTVLGPGDLATKKPGTGLPADRLTDVVGRRLRRAVRANAPLRAEDLEE
jgi:N,N'-diacetyllegionaminate synthase